MDLSCNECLAGPAGIAGHPGLWVRSLDGAQMIFRCAGCETLWSRDGDASGYEWAVVDGRAAARRAGVAVPSRSEPRLALYAWRGVAVTPAAEGRS